jgi:hypothetical protein
MVRPVFGVLIRFSAVAIVAVGLSACSDLPDWLGGGDSTPADEPSTATDASASIDQPAGPQGKTVAEASDRYPTLADTPSKAPATSTSDEQKQVAGALVADRSQAQYSADALRAGDVTAAAPPPPASAESSTAAPPLPASDNSSSAAAAPAAAPSPPPSTAPAPPPPPPPATAVASNATPAVSVPPPPPPPPPPVRPAVTDDAALGFQPSHAPPLDPSVAQMMGAPHQQRLASVSPRSAAPVSIPGGAPAAVVAFPENSIGLDANGLAQVQAAVAAFKMKGSSGYVRVVGHSASGAPNLSADKQLMQSFERSQACANSVARQLIRDGVPANRVLVDATSTLAPGEQRRAEIFF